MGVALYRWVKVQLEETGNDIHKKNKKKTQFIYGSSSIRMLRIPFSEEYVSILRYSI